MSTTRESDWRWIWPEVGPTPINQGLDSEMFDRSDFPYSETFVREAIQNSLDAKLPGCPVVMSFTFFDDASERQMRFLRPVIDFRREAGLEVPDDWARDRVRWIVVEDSDSTGLLGDLTKRTSDFWNYWLNFGVSNKTGRGRGGRGIGRVTFLIASQIQSVIGYTRRQKDWQQAVCGMTVLPPLMNEDEPRATHAYLAEKEAGSVWRLHDADRIAEDARRAFNFPNYEQQLASGLALAIPYPHPELEPDGILAAAIENFAPAFISDAMVLRVNDEHLDRESIDEIANRVSGHMRDAAIRDDPARFLSLIRCALREDPAETIFVDGAKRDELKRIGSKQGRKYSRILDRTGRVPVTVEFPLRRRADTTTGSVDAVIAATPPGRRPIDRLFREGMSLPLVRSSTPGEHDLILIVESGALAQYLNLCEGKAHLDLSQSKEISAKIASQGFRDGYRVKHLVKALPDDLRLLFSPDGAEPSRDVFRTFFSITEQTKPGKGPSPPPPPPPPPPKPPYFKVKTLANGFELRANRDAESWPVNLTLRVAYADGSRRPSWSPFDFEHGDLSTESEGCEVTWDDNTIRALSCTPDCRIKVTGFDTEREVDTTMRVWRDAQKN